MARFGFNRYALVLVALGFAGLGSGCGGGGSGGGSASTVAPSTSGSNAAPTTSSTTTAPVASAAILSGVSFVDVDASQTITKGDKLVCSFTGAVAPIGTSNTIDPTQEFALAVGGDSFGAGATMANGSAANEVAIVLGDAPVLQISESFSVAKTTPGSGSGLNVSPVAKGDIKSREGIHVSPAAQPLDIVGALQPGFRPAASLNVARGQHVAVTLDDGRVLVVGGIMVGRGKADDGKSGDFVAEAELFDPLAASWTKVSDLSGSRMMNGRVAVKPALCTATKLTDGTVLICGGVGVERRGFLGLGGEKVDTLDSAFIFDPTTNTFTKVGDMNWSRHSHTATVMSDGRVLIAGGYNDSFWRSDKTQAPFEIYDPAKKKFEPSGSIFSRFKSVEARQSHTATPIEGGSGILLAGGNHWKGGGLFGLIKPKLEINKGSEVVRGLRTERAGDLLAPRLNHGAAPAGPRGVLIAGGHDTNGAVAGLELYDTATAQWSAAGNLVTARSGCEVAVDRNLLLVIGGYTGTGETGSVEIFDADAKALSATTYTLATPRNGCAVVTLKDGRILVTGGLTGATKSFDSLDGQAIDSCEVFVRQ
jgi:hypothetical protein